MKRFSFIAFMVVFNSNAEEYTSFANGILLTPTDVNITIIQIGDEAPDCLDEGLSFPLDQQYSSAWLDTVVLSRQQQQLIDFNFDADTCLINSIAMPMLYEDNEGDVVAGDLQESGLNGNVALIGTNGLDQDSFRSSQHYKVDEVAAAFDGYLYTQQFNEESSDKIARGIWLSEIKNTSEQDLSPWVEIDYGYRVTLRGLGVFINKQSLELGRLPRYVTLLTSEDGVDFDEESKFTLSLKESNTFTFSSELNARFFKLRFESNFGDSKFIEIDEIELYQ